MAILNQREGFVTIDGEPCQEFNDNEIVQLPEVIDLEGHTDAMETAGADRRSGEEAPGDDIEELKARYRELATIEILFKRVYASGVGKASKGPKPSSPAREEIPEKVVNGDAISMAAR